MAATHTPFHADGSINLAIIEIPAAHWLSTGASHGFIGGTTGESSTLVASMAQIASAAPELPFYYYEIPTMTGLSLSPSEFLAQAAECIPNLAGIKFTSSNLMEYQLCRASHAHEGRFDIPFGSDERLLAALALGATGGGGQLLQFRRADLPARDRCVSARRFHCGPRSQMKSVRVIQTLASRS